jgi:two-component system phosphate regulon sensor histidine kinase PhoR
LLKGLTGIILSLVLCSIVVFSLYYLLYIIRKQKQLSEIKHDFISNVTHEFKTPIATVSSAIEAIKNFNNENISDKTKRYLDISEQQLKKLNILVEKVMETSLLESSELNFDYINTDIIQLIKNSAEKHQMNTNKNIHFESIVKMLVMDIDEFHFENAISNLIDNAIKYGGNTINISINKSSEESLFISINDNGEGISKLDEPYIFDKFYRTKTKNIHNIKGFGIGLYYAKNIIEKHKGIIELKNRNTFLITLWTK